MKLLRFFLASITLLLVAHVDAYSVELTPDIDGNRYYLIDSSKRRIAPDLYTFNVLTNYSHNTSSGISSAIYQYSINCRINRLGHLGSRAYSKPWAKGVLISRESSRHFEDIENDPQALEFLRLICQ